MSIISRRNFIQVVGFAGAASLLPRFPQSSIAQNSTKKSLKLGTFEISIFSDGFIGLPAESVAPSIDPEKRKSALVSAGQSGDTIRSPINVTMVKTSQETILIDVGSGTRFLDTAGKLAEVLEENGIDFESISKVVFTHAHPDHLWGVINDFDELSFPNAEYLISEAEWNFWMDKDVLSKLPETRHGFAVGAQRNLSAIKEKISTIKPNEEILSGISAINTAGHTPGHISIQLSANSENLVIIGDALIHPVISFEYPEWKPASDQDGDLAVRTRKRLLDKLAQENSKIIGYHLPFPGTGTVTRSGNSYKYQAG